MIPVVYPTRGFTDFVGFTVGDGTGNISLVKRVVNYSLNDLCKIE